MRKKQSLSGIADKLTACACLLELADAGLELRRGDSAKLYRAQLDVRGALTGLRGAIDELADAGERISPEMTGLRRLNTSLIARIAAWGRAGF